MPTAGSAAGSPDGIVVGLDLGTSAIKVVALGASLEVLGAASAGFATDTRDPHQAEQSCADWLSATTRAFAELDTLLTESVGANWRSRVDGIGLTAQLPTLVVVGTGALRLISGLPPEHASQSESIVALVSGAIAGLIGWAWGGFERPRSRCLFAMAVGVAAGAVVALYA